MPSHKKHITQEEYDEAITSYYDLGFSVGYQTRAREMGRSWLEQAKHLSLSEKQTLVILEEEEF